MVEEIIDGKHGLNETVLPQREVLGGRVYRSGIVLFRMKTASGRFPIVDGVSVVGLHSGWSRDVAVPQEGFASSK